MSPAMLEHGALLSHVDPPSTEPLRSLYLICKRMHYKSVRTFIQVIIKLCQGIDIVKICVS